MFCCANPIARMARLSTAPLPISPSVQLQEIAAIKLALQHKHDLAAFRENAQLNPNFTLRQGLSIGAVTVLEALARELGLVKALGTDREGKLALWQVIARVIDQGSRLSAAVPGSNPCLLRLAKVGCFQ